MRIRRENILKKQPDWKLMTQRNNPSPSIYERLIFKHRDSSAYLIADAYDGAMIRRTIVDFLDYSAGKGGLLIDLDSVTINGGGKSNLICYVGHDGLMDFSLEGSPEKTDHEKREVVILACASRNFFSDHLKKTGAYPLLWTTHLMCPEAYTLDAAIDSWLLRDAPSTTRETAAQTYNRYQKCGIKGARSLLVTGF
jgi:hypothetical protein